MRSFIIKVTKYAVLAFLLLSGTIYLCIRLRPDYFLGASTDYYYCKFQYNKIDQQLGYRNIIVGDSRGNASIDPRGLGATWINLSIPGSDFFEGYLALKHYLSKNTVDTLVMLYGLEFIAGKSEYFSIRTVPFQFATSNEFAGLESVERKMNLEFHGSTSGSLSMGEAQLRLKQWKRNLRYHHFPFSYRSTFLDALKKFVFSRAETSVKKVAIESQLKDGLGHINFGLEDSSHFNSIGTGDYSFNPDPINLAYLDSIMKLTSQKNIATILIIAPINEASYSTYKNSRYEHSVNRFLDSVAGVYPKLDLIRDPVAMPDSLFGDIYHVNKRGTLLYTSQLQKRISKATPPQP